MALLYFASFFIFLFGLCVGSFLNCVIYRLEQGRSFLKGRSFCPNCKHNLIWKDLIPVFSFLFLKGQCRYCRTKISKQYPLAEITTGVLFVFIFLSFGFDLTFGFRILDFVKLIFWFYIASVLIIIFIYDLKHYLILDNILFPAIIVTIIYRIFEFLNFKNWDLFRIWILDFGISAPLLNYFYASLIGFAFFFVIWLVSGGRWMGFGDVKLAILLGLILGFPNILIGLFLSFFFGSIVSIVLMVFAKKQLKSEIPFGPFLIAGTFAAMFWGQEMIRWYLNLILI